MPVFDFPRITILPDAEGRKLVRATVVNQRTRATTTIWEYIDGARVCEFRRNPAGDSDLMSATVPI